jgi:type VI secretion system protein ImpK
MHLTDCFMELVAYVVYFQKTINTKQPPYEEVRADIIRLLTQSDVCLKKGLFTQDDYNQARFAICAWTDEAILGSAWNGKTQWQREMLQRTYFNTSDAGEEFFERLNSLGIHQREVREVYYLCLALGFTGRYCNEGDEYLLEQLKASNLKLLTGSSLGIPSLERAELFPEAFPVEIAGPDINKTKSVFSVLTIAGVAGPVLLFGILLLIYKFTLSGIGENFLRSIP